MWKKMYPYFSRTWVCTFTALIDRFLKKLQKTEIMRIETNLIPEIYEFGFLRHFIHNSISFYGNNTFRESKNGLVFQSFHVITMRKK